MDIEIRQQHTIQANGTATCCRQCRYGGPIRCRKLRILLAAPLYQFFISFLMVLVFCLAFVTLIDLAKQDVRSKIEKNEILVNCVFTILDCNYRVKIFFLNLILLLMSFIES